VSGSTCGCAHMVGSEDGCYAAPWETAHFVLLHECVELSDCFWCFLGGDPDLTFSLNVHRAAAQLRRGPGG
jgi:hypothetical protein